MPQQAAKYQPTHCGGEGKRVLVWIWLESGGLGWGIRAFFCRTY